MGFFKDFLKDLLNSRHAEPQGETVDVTAGASCVIHDVCVSNDSTVKFGDAVVMVDMESMLIPIVAPADGVITDLSVSRGEAIKEGTVVCKINRAST